MRNSFIISKLLSFIKTMLYYIEKSLVGRFFINLGIWLRNAMKKSVISRFFMDNSRTENYYENSILGAFGKTYKKSNILKSLCKSSKILKYVSEFFDNILNYSVRLYGVFLSVYSTIYVSYLLISENENMALIYILLSTCVFGAVLILVNKSISGLLNGAYTFKFIKTLITEDAEKKLIQNDVLNPYKFFIALSVLAAFLSIILGIKIVILTFIIFLGISFCFKFTDFVVIVVTGILPFLPTKVLVLLSIVLLVITIFKNLINEKTEKLSKTVLSLWVTLMCAVFIYGALNSFAVKSSILVAAVWIAFVTFYFTMLNNITTKKNIKTFIITVLYMFKKLDQRLNMLRN